MPPADRADAATVAGRALLLAVLGWWTLRFVPHPLDAPRIIDSFLHLVALPFHEAGHVLFAPFGGFMTALGGSLLQVLVPIVCAAALWRRGDAFGTAVCAWWAGAALVDLGPYIADARALQLPLLGGHTGAEVEGHDWEAILASLRWLHLDRRLGLAAHWLGSLTMLGGLGAASLVLRRPTGGPG